jgi:N-acetylmuramoyl-L-alanine amidase
MCAMLLIPFPQTIVTEDVIGSTQGEKEAAYTGTILKFEDSAGVTGLRIPLADVVKANQIVVENRYMDNALWIYIKQGEQQEGNDIFYQDNPILGEKAEAFSGTAEMQGENLLLKFQLDDIYECQTSLEQNYLHVQLLDPKEVYDHIIVIDPAWGGGETGAFAQGLSEKDVTLGIAWKVKEKLDIGEIKAYYTRLDDSDVSLEERVRTVEEVHADFVISIRAIVDQEDPRHYGTGCYYNGSFFIPYFGNVQLADLLVKEVVTATSGRADGLWAIEEEIGTDEDSLLEQLKIPAAQVSIGYLSHGIENQLLFQESYQEKAAEGIVAAIQKAYEALKGENE